MSEGALKGEYFLTGALIGDRPGEYSFTSLLASLVDFSGFLCLGEQFFGVTFLSGLAPLVLWLALSPSLQDLFTFSDFEADYTVFMECFFSFGWVGRNKSLLQCLLLLLLFLRVAAKAVGLADPPAAAILRKEVYNALVTFH